MDTTRVVVFFDWQNVYSRAREAFFDKWNDPHMYGQVDPVDLAMTLVDKAQQNRSGEKLELEQIRIYRGRPTQQDDPNGYDAFQRQDGTWRRNNKIVRTYKDLRYPQDWGEPTCDEKPREKGIDVSIAIDLVSMARDEAFDLAILMSADYDLLPAVDYVQFRHQLRGDGPTVEVAAWKSEANGKPLRLRSDKHRLWCHWLDKQDYYGVEDVTNYRSSVRSSTSGPKPGGWMR